MASTSLRKPTRALVLGYYDRHNAGDEQYKTSIPIFFGASFECDFECIDDAKPMDSDSEYDIVLCGGGDIINPYFMDKVERIVAKYTRAVYGFSVGIPYDADLSYVDIFDHLVVRSKYDFDLVAERLGSENVTFLPDVAFINQIQKVIYEPDRDPMVRFGVCLATPILLNEARCTQHIASAVSTFIRAVPSECHFFMFNSNPLNANESDETGIYDVLDAMDETTRGRCVIRNDAIDASNLIEAISKMDFNVCFRYHSAVFSIAAGVPIIAVAATKKMTQLMVDVELPSIYVVNVRDKLAMESLASTMIRRMTNRTPLPKPDIGRYQSNTKIREAVGSRKYRQLLIQSERLSNKSLQEAVVACIELLNALYGHEHVTSELVFTKGAFDLKGKDPMRIARVVCFAVSGDYDNACTWGMSRNLSNPDFVLYDAIVYVYTDMKTTRLQSTDTDPKDTVAYYPKTGVAARPMLSIDPFLDSKTRANVHRSGWSFVVNHLLNFHAPRFRRPPSMIVDTYVERTFHWGFDALMLSGFLPYRSEWMGFIHHTYDRTHSSFNCDQLFQNAMFIESLPQCKCLFVLSEYLANQLRGSLRRSGNEDVIVVALTHPTEFVQLPKMFSMTKFLSGERKVIQIGAWLRNSFSIFDLPLYNDKLNPLKITKAALKGNNMDGYYVNEEEFQHVIDAVDEATKTNTPMYTCDPVYINENSTMHRNKFVVGMVNTLVAKYNSVEIIDKKDNDAYDDLLATNIVFLDLVDCSAANTVLECIVRNTVIVVNNHSALEEVLGRGYPGFYDTAVEATMILGSLDRLSACYMWLTNLDKTNIMIETFVDEFVTTCQQLS
jgi:hypothetical protein